jgi:hypothetical protein
MAAECPNGSVPWKTIYGEREFVLRPPLFESQLRAARERKRVDPQALERAAKHYAQARLAALEESERRQREVAAAAGMAGVAGAAVAPATAVVAAPATVGLKREGWDAGAAAATAAAPAGAASAAADEALPSGWASATAPSGKKYYYHTTTQKRVWRRPTAETPIS